ncbi:glycosyltransferase, partial [Methylobacterium trifolii]
MEFFLVAVGTHGDVLPFIALGHELARRGHGVAVESLEPDHHQRPVAG